MVSGGSQSSLAAEVEGTFQSESTGRRNCCLSYIQTAVVQVDRFSASVLAIEMPSVQTSLCRHTR